MPGRFRSRSITARTAQHGAGMIAARLDRLADHQYDRLHRMSIERE